MSAGIVRLGWALRFDLRWIQWGWWYWMMDKVYMNENRKKYYNFLILNTKILNNAKTEGKIW